MKRQAAAIPLALPLAFLIGTSACTLAPVYTRPKAPVATSWPEGGAYTASEPSAPSAADVEWKNFFADEKLRKLVALALENNRDLRAAALNVERTQAQYQIQRADLFPKANAAGTASGQRIPRDFSASGQGMVVHQYTVGVGVAGYELDLFGRVRSLNERALQQYLSTEQARRATQISLVAAVSNQYLTLGADLDHLKLARETLTNQETAYGLAKRRFLAGVTSELDLRQSQTALETARGDIARYTSLVAQDKNALELLVGAGVPADLLPEALAPATALPGFSPGVPSEVLQRRPDILQSEDQLRAANANIGAARAAFFPRIALTTSVGLGSTELSGLFDRDSRMWTFAPQITIPIFQGGANVGNLKAAEADRNIAVAQYEKAIQTAFREVADALAQFGTLQEQASAQEALVEASGASYRLSDARYRNGVDSYLPVLDSQRALYAAQQNLISLRLSRFSNLVTLYKVLGGGA